MSTSILQYTEEERTYRLKAGSHTINDKDKTKIRVLEPGDTITTKMNMIRLHGPNRWERVTEGGRQETIEDLRVRLRLLEEQARLNAAPIPSDDLSTKTIKQLREIAAQMDPPVDLPSAMSKDEIIEAINSAMDAA